MEEVILVDKEDKEKGFMEKLEAHRQGLLHRAISVFLFKDNHELLLQKRADGKYHSAGLWTNTCCSHPHPGEHVAEAAARRLKEEMGLVVELKWCFRFQYKVELNDGLIENELDHVFIGKCNSIPTPNPDEVSEWKYLGIDNIIEDIDSNPDEYTYWFKHVIHRVIAHYSGHLL